MTCPAGKVAYPTFDQARQRADAMRTQHLRAQGTKRAATARLLTPYRCRSCGLWHVGHQGGGRHLP